MSVPSSKSIVMSVREYFDTERISFWFGMPSISCSTGTAMRVSTSSGVMPGAFRMIFTCVLETSGKASIGRPSRACTPAPMRSAVSTTSNRRCASEKRIRAVSMVCPLFLADTCEDGLQAGNALDGHFLARFDAVDLDVVATLAEDTHWPGHEMHFLVVAGGLHENPVFPIMIDQGAGRQSRPGAARTAHLDGDGLPWNQLLAALADFGAQQHGLACRIDRLAHGQQLADDVGAGHLERHTLTQAARQAQGSLHFQPQRR